MVSGQENVNVEISTGEPAGSGGPSGTEVPTGNRSLPRRREWRLSLDTSEECVGFLMQLKGAALVSASDANKRCPIRAEVLVTRDGKNLWEQNIDRLDSSKCSYQPTWTKREMVDRSLLVSKNDGPVRVIHNIEKIENEGSSALQSSGKDEYAAAQDDAMVVDEEAETFSEVKAFEAPEEEGFRPD